MRDCNLSLLTRCKLPARHILSGVWVTVGILSASCGSSTTALEASDEGHIEHLSEALSVSPNIVISQVYGAGGNTGALYTNDFVELFNRSSAPVSLTGWSVQYASAAGGGNFASPIPLSGNLGPGQYYLVQAGGGSNGSPMPTPDATGTTLMSASAGKVALINIATVLACNGGSTPCTPAQEANIVDLVGYGNANYFEGSAAPTLSTTLAARRAAAGCTDTNQNGSDFTAGAPTPRNTGSPTNPCGGNAAPYVTTSVPSNGASSVAVTTDLAINFSEDVTATGSWFTISCTVTGSVSAAVSGGPANYVLDPAVSLTAGETCTVTIVASQVTDLLGANMAANHVFSFSTGAPAGATSIHTIQGASHISPLNGAAVTTRGIVTAVTSNGYFLAEPVADANPSTSEGIFVFTGSAPGVAAGDDVQVTASVAEYRPGCSGCTPSNSAYANLTTTELSSVTAQSVLSSGNPLPAPVVIGIGGRTPPTSVIEDDASGDVELVNTFDPANDGLDFYESLEGMRVQINNAVAVGPTSTFTSGKELPVLGDNGSQGGLRTSRGGILITATDFNPERLTLSNYLVSSMPDANVGDTFPGAIVGVVDYSFANFKILYSQPLPTLVATGVTQETLSLGARRSLEIDFAAFNVENLDPLDPPAKFAQLAAILVNNLQSPDVVSLGEIQDNDGPANSSTVSATTTLNMLVSAITAAGGPSYSHRNINPVDDQDGGEPGGNIRVAFLYRTDRGVAFVDRPGAGSTTANSVVNNGGAPALQFSPGRIDPANSAFSSSRKPLVGEFTFQSRTFFVLANHFNSKGGDEPLFGRLQPPTLSSETQRIAQATVVASFVQQILAIDPNAPIVLLGDLNDFEFSPPVAVLKNAQLTALVETLPAAERYSYVYQGNSQVLDHGMVSPGVLPHLVGYDVVHVNAEFVNPASDHDPSVTRVGFDFTPPVISGPSSSVHVSATGAGGGVATFSVSASDNLDGSLPVTCTPASGTTFAVGTTPVTCTATDSNGNSTQFGFAVVVTLNTTPVPLGPGWLLTRALPALLMGLGCALRRRNR